MFSVEAMKLGNSVPKGLLGKVAAPTEAKRVPFLSAFSVRQT